jgi:RNA polymerase sigma-70 factor (ECF subfamily)
MSDTGRDVSRLIERAREGDAPAQADPSDIVQESLVQAFEHFAQFRGGTEAELIAWLRQILARRLASLARKYRGTAARNLAREQAIAGALDRSSHALGNLVPARGPTPTQEARRRERSVILADALAALPEDHREVVTLKVFRQLRWDEVGQEMGRSPDAVRMLWGRAIKRLAAHLGEVDLWTAH